MFTMRWNLHLPNMLNLIIKIHTRNPDEIHHFGFVQLDVALVCECR
jgi:hypothetical protein